MIPAQIAMIPSMLMAALIQSGREPGFSTGSFHARVSERDGIAVCGSRCLEWEGSDPNGNPQSICNRRTGQVVS